MFKTHLSALIVGTALLASMSAHASNGTISVTGSVTAGTCTLASGGNYTIALPAVSTSAFKGVGDTAGSRWFTIAGTNCSGTSIARVYFEAGPNTDMSTGYLKTGAATVSPATGVEAKFTLWGAPVPANLAAGPCCQQAGTVGFLPGSTAFRLVYRVEYVSTAAKVGAGNFDSWVTYSMVYQ